MKTRGIFAILANLLALLSHGRKPKTKGPTWTPGPPSVASIQPRASFHETPPRAFGGPSSAGRKLARRMARYNRTHRKVVRHAQEN